MIAPVDERRDGLVRRGGIEFHHEEVGVLDIRRPAIVLEEREERVVIAPER